MKLPRLSLRELFLLVALAAMGCGWWIDRSRLAANAEEMRFKLQLWPTRPGEKVELVMDRAGEVFVRRLEANLPPP
jgi:hypothetical protein